MCVIVTNPHSAIAQSVILIQHTIICHFTCMYRPNKLWGPKFGFTQARKLLHSRNQSFKQRFRCLYFGGILCGHCCELTSTLSGTCEPSSWPGSRPGVMEVRRVEDVSAKRIAWDFVFQRFSATLWYWYFVSSAWSVFGGFSSTLWRRVSARQTAAGSEREQLRVARKGRKRILRGAETFALGRSGQSC